MFALLHFKKYFIAGNDDLPFELDLDEIDLSTWDSAMVRSFKTIPYLLIDLQTHFKNSVVGNFDFFVAD